MATRTSTQSGVASRTKAILRQAATAGYTPGIFDSSLLIHSAEKRLAAEFSTGALEEFFSNVMVMVEDSALRANRLALLKQVADGN